MSEEVKMSDGLAANRLLRQQVIEKLMDDPTTFIDPKQTRVLLSALKDSDASLIGEVRANAEDKNADANAQISQIAASMAQKFPGQDLLARPVLEGEVKETTSPPAVEFDDLGMDEDEITEGMLEPISEPETYEQFQQRFPEEER